MSWSYSLSSMMTFSTPAARAPSLPGLGLIHRSASLAMSVFWGSTTISLLPASRAFSRVSLLNPPVGVERHNSVLEVALDAAEDRERAFVVDLNALAIVI